MKRVIDLLLAICSVIILILPMLLICFLQKSLMGSPILFHQKRIGMNGRYFYIHKFRTMRKGNESDSKRLTKWGKFLRSSSLDELPEIWNVFMGEMSFVGPRPLPVSYETRYSDQQKRRHNVLPGITGWAQINGRNRISWVDQFKYDCWYVDNQSIMLDLKILLLTIGAVLLRKDISEKNQATRSEFLGNKK